MTIKAREGYRNVEAAGNLSDEEIQAMSDGRSGELI